MKDDTTAAPAPSAPRAPRAGPEVSVRSGPASAAPHNVGVALGQATLFDLGIRRKGTPTVNQASDQQTADDSPTAVPPLPPVLGAPNTATEPHNGEGLLPTGGPTPTEEGTTDDGPQPTDPRPSDRSQSTVVPSSMLPATPRPATKRHRAADTPPHTSLASVVQPHPPHSKFEALLRERLSPLLSRIDELTADNAALHKSLARAKRRIKGLERNQYSRRRSVGDDRDDGEARASPVLGPAALPLSPDLDASSDNDNASLQTTLRPNRTMAQVVAAAYAATPPVRRTVATRMQGLVSGEAPLGDYFRLPRSDSATPRPVRDEGDRLAPLYVRTRLAAEARGAPIRVCKMALRKCPGMPVFYEVCPIGSGLTLWEVFLPRKHHEAFAAAIAATKGGIYMAEDDFTITSASKLAMPTEDNTKAERTLTLRRGRQLAGAISGRVYAALLEFTPPALRTMVLQAADVARRAMAAAARSRPTEILTTAAPAASRAPRPPEDEAGDDPMDEQGPGPDADPPQ
ncbi:hypothetical protein HK405_008830 [Cladochytrium tenue]|nr:hypothetical protein HK405_008830 [Cladochytrium tenue]